MTDLDGGARPNPYSSLETGGKKWFQARTLDDATRSIVFTGTGLSTRAHKEVPIQRGKKPSKRQLPLILCMTPNGK